MKNFDEFYPTPESLFEIATEGCDFKKNGREFSVTCIRDESPQN